MKLTIEIEMESREIAEKLVSQLAQQPKVRLLSAHVSEAIYGNSNASASQATSSSASAGQTNPASASTSTASATTTASSGTSQPNASASANQNGSSAETSAQGNNAQATTSASNQTNGSNANVDKLVAKYGAVEPVYGNGAKVVNGKPAKEYTASELFAVSDEGKAVVKQFYDSMKSLVGDTTQTLALREKAQQRIYWTEKCWIANGLISEFSPVLWEDLK